MDEVEVTCPYCGESIVLAVDASGGSQRYVEDCSVCCQPMVVSYSVDDDGEVSELQVEREDEA